MLSATTQAMPRAQLPLSIQSCSTVSQDDAVCGGSSFLLGESPQKLVLGSDIDLYHPHTLVANQRHLKTDPGKRKHGFIRDQYPVTPDIKFLEGEYISPASSVLFSICQKVTLP